MARVHEKSDLRVAVVGCGRGGCAIAGEFVRRGCSVLLYDNTEYTRARAFQTLRASLYDHVASGYLLKPDVDELIGRITLAHSLPEALEKSQLVVESVFEDLQLKRELFNQMGEILKQRASADMSLGDGKRFPKCHIFSTMFYPKLMQNATFDYSRVRRWTMAKKMAHGDVFGMDLVLVPIHCNGNHWTLAVINFVDRRFEYHDSLRGSGRHVIKNLRDWLRKESADKRKWLPLTTSPVIGNPKGNTLQELHYQS